MESICTTRDSGLASALGDLVLKVHGGPTDGEIVRFGERKSTVGSDATCTYRICDDQVQSVQCLILRGRGGSLVRRWADGTLLNGQQFLDSRLEVGDSLMIGPVEMEVIQDDASPTWSAEVPSRREEPLPPEIDAQQTDRLRSMEDVLQETCDDLRREIASLGDERQIWRDQRDHWESQMAGYQGALSGLTRQFDEFRQARQQEHDAWLEELQQLQALVGAAAGTGHEPPAEHDILLNEEAVEPSMAGDQGLDGCEETTSSTVPSPAERGQVEGQEDCEVASSRPFTQDEAPIPGLDRLIYDETEEAVGDQELDQEEEPQWLKDRGSLLQSPDFASDTFDAGDESHDDLGDVIPAGSECTPGDSCMMENYDQGEGADTFDPGDESHDDLGDVVPAGGECTPDDSCMMENYDQGEASDTDEDLAETQPPGWLANYQEQQGESDSSITDYMNRLLRRVDGDDEARPFGDESGAKARAPTTEDKRSSGIVAPSPSIQTAPAAALEQPEPPISSAEDGEEAYMPRSAAPERNSNLAAMRELANASARNAIQTCDKKRTAKGAMGRVPLLAMELGCGGLLLYWAIHYNQGVAYAGSAVCFTAAAMTGVHTLWLFLRTALAGLTMPGFRKTAKPSHADAVKQIQPAEDGPSG